jgi:CheY-like chemotaxis protein
MAMYVYSTAGVPVGFVHGATVHDLEGWPLGRLVGTRVHRFDGAYVGEYFKDMVVTRGDGRARTLSPVPVPSRQPPPPEGDRRRIVIDYGHADAFHLLDRDEALASSASPASMAEETSASEDLAVQPGQTFPSPAEAQEKPPEPDTVLVVDDEPMVREMIGHALRELGFQVQEARSGSEAVAMIAASRPQLVILDFLMPDMDGAEVAREVGKLDPDLPIVFSTGHSALRALRNAAGGGIPVLPKPFSVDELDTLLSETLTEHRTSLAGV